MVHHPLFEVHTEAVRYPVDEVEVAADKAGCADLWVRPASGYEGLHIVLGAGRGCSGELDTPVEQGPYRGLQWCGAVVLDDGPDQLRFASFTERLPV